MSKFEKVFLYVLHKIGNKPNVGKTFLHKIMYFIDFDYYEKTNESLTGVDYFKSKYGPTFAKPYIENMKKKGLIEMKQSLIKGFNKTTHNFIPLKESDLIDFSKEQKEHIDKTLDKHLDKTAKQMEAFSHGDIPWLTTKDTDKISYGKVFYRTDKYSVRIKDHNDPI